MALADLDDMMRLTEQLIVGVTQHLNATRVIPWKLLEQILAIALQREADLDPTSTMNNEFDIEDMMVDLVPPWPRRPVYEFVRNITGIDFASIDNANDAIRVARQEGMTIDEPLMFPHVIDVVKEIFNQLVVPSLIQPTFLVDRPSEKNAGTGDSQNSSTSNNRFQLYINGLKFAEGFSGLTDPLEYRTQQSFPGQEGQGIHPQDDDHLNALKYGMPPSGSLTIYLDRLIMLLTGAVDIRDVIYFPIFQSAK